MAQVLFMIHIPYSERAPHVDTDAFKTEFTGKDEVLNEESTTVNKEDTVTTTNIQESGDSQVKGLSFSILIFQDNSYEIDMNVYHEESTKGKKTERAVQRSTISSPETSFASTIRN